MSPPIVFVSRHRIKPGMLDAFRGFLDSGIPGIRDGRPGTLVFAAYLDPEESEVSIVHVFRDADAMDRHLEGVDERSSGAYQFVEPQSFTIYGTPSAAAMAGMRRAAETAGPDVTLDILPAHIGGFARSADSDG